jgi:hypothetical protein
MVAPYPARGVRAMRRHPVNAAQRNIPALEICHGRFHVSRVT